MSDSPPKHSAFHDAQPSHQLNREAKWALYLTLIYLTGWIASAYFAPNTLGILGLPLWFELSCILLPILFILVSAAVLKLVYQQVDLDGQANTKKADE
ncbi:YhdT family protein [Moraxella oculi]|uniref:YhdT family protein n=1 Tax=Moraxella oculi TaxID=2940516 RepID=A0ABW8U749_9GAMM